MRSESRLTMTEVDFLSNLPIEPEGIFERALASAIKTLDLFLLRSNLGREAGTAVWKWKYRKSGEAE